MKRVLCFGDSNTWGYDPATQDRFDRDVRWTGVLRNALGDAYEILEEGLNGRTTVWNDPIEGYKNGREYLIPCLETHRPLDLVIIMLRTDGQHGTGEIGRQMGPVSGFVLRVSGEPTLYVAGDTVWCDDVENALNFHAPEVVIVNAGAAQFLTGGPITMTAEDVLRVVQECPGAIVVAVHMEAINHCGMTRAALAGALAEAGVEDRVQIPLEGDRLQF